MGRGGRRELVFSTFMSYSTITFIGYFPLRFFLVYFPSTFLRQNTVIRPGRLFIFSRQNTVALQNISSFSTCFQNAPRQQMCIYACSLPIPRELRVVCGNSPFRCFHVTARLYYRTVLSLPMTYHTIPYRVAPFISILYSSIPYFLIPHLTVPFFSLPYCSVPSHTVRPLFV